ncbi:MAG: hypothetical protein ABIR70_07065 [Bryobacteraceae bacterium]
MFLRPSRALSLPILLAALSSIASAQTGIPRTAAGKPDLQGVWQARSRAAYDLQDHAARFNMPAGKSVVDTGTIPYQPAALTKKLENYANRKTADPLSKCFLPGVPRIMYMESPFQIFQTTEHVAMTFEWTQVFRLIYTNGKTNPHAGYESWMGSSRGKWDGDTLVVEVTDFNDQTWFDMAGDFHSDALKVTERYKLLDADTIQYEATIEDPKTFTKAWKITVPLIRQKGVDRVLEYQCQAESEESSGLFERDLRTWYPEPGTPPSPLGPIAPLGAGGTLPEIKTGAALKRQADGKPDISGYFNSSPGGANYGLEKHARDGMTPGTQGVIIDPVDRLLPYKAWSKEERTERELPRRGYDDPTAHCFVAGIPRSLYVPSPFHVLQVPGYVVFLHERMSWRIVRLTGTHLPDTIRLWQGDSIGHWEGDTLVVDTTNLNGKAWLNEVGEVLSHAAHIVERFSPQSPGVITYTATVSDPIPYTKPWTIQFPLNGDDKEELLEVACLEDNGDLQHLKDVRDEYRAQQKKGN